MGRPSSRGGGRGRRKTAKLAWRRATHDRTVWLADPLQPPRGYPRLSGAVEVPANHARIADLITIRARPSLRRVSLAAFTDYGPDLLSTQTGVHAGYVERQRPVRDRTERELGRLRLGLRRLQLLDIREVSRSAHGLLVADEVVATQHENTDTVDLDPELGVPGILE